MIDQVLWEQELAEHLHRDTKERGAIQARGATKELDEPGELRELELLNGLKELDELNDTPRAEPPIDSNDYPPAVVILLWSLAVVVVSAVGLLIGYFVV
ncbi:MAG: hypothetical protein GEU83_16560 [Pseudonocardiaceae bacterium]|nr:hypothetical protein [Pseudonocardiaceae bacterium]